MRDLLGVYTLTSELSLVLLVVVHSVCLVVLDKSQKYRERILGKQLLRMGQESSEIERSTICWLDVYGSATCSTIMACLVIVST